MNIHAPLKLFQQLALAFGSMVILATMLASVGWAQIKVIQHHFDGVVDRTLPTLSALSNVQEKLQQLRIAELQHLTALTMPEKDREELKVKLDASAFDEALQQYLDVSAGLSDASLVTQLRARVAIARKNRIKFFQMSNSAAGAGIERAEEARDYFNGEGLQAFAGVYAATQQLRELHVRQADAAKALGAAALASAMRLLLGVGTATVLLSVLLAVFITRQVTRQIGGEPADVAYIARRIGDGDLDVPIPVKAPGDRSLMGVMGQMQSALRSMVAELRETQNRLVAAARVAGMAEIAANVLHNVGNVLNSVNVSAGLVSAKLHKSKIKGLSKAVQMMGSHTGDLGAFLAHDPKGKLLPAYLREVSQALEDEHQAMSAELAALIKSVDHIKEVVAIQQSYAGAAPFVEMLKPGELVDEALRMSASALTRHKVIIVKNLAETAPLPLDRHRVLQILVNLISNAKHAVSAASENPCITLSTALVDGPALRMTVGDNGEGIPPENLTRIFSHGFTTRKDGHGFGLHSCVLAAKEMGGVLSAHSEGPGRGAEFTLEIPLQIAEEHR